MAALIVGADRIESIRGELSRIAHCMNWSGEAEHWTGRKPYDAKRTLPHNVRLVIIVCDRSNHMLMKNVRTQADKRNIPVVFCRHSVTELRERLDELLRERRFLN